MIFDNKPLEDLNEENDLFGLLEKANTINNLLNHSSNFIKENQMIGIYGGWGTGKTTMLKYLEKNLNRDKYHPIFFEAWKNEKDENLALSLANSLVAECKSPKALELAKSFIEISKKIFKGFSKGITVRIAPIPGTSFSWSAKELAQGLEEKEEKENSYSEEVQEFTNAFREVEKKILGRRKDGKIIILIDDLDRCEPENILNLISAIKLFFTYGERTIYFCGIDKVAVSKAIQHKYKDVIKAEEYLEKIFDITFKMPRQYDMRKMFTAYFSSAKSKTREFNFAEISSEFFNIIGFTNPRHIKKVLNKYSIISELKRVESYNELIPDIISPGGNVQGNVIDSIFVLYFLVLLDYYPKSFSDLTKIDKRISIYSAIYYQAHFSSDSRKRDKSYFIHQKRMRDVLSKLFGANIREYIDFKLKEANPNLSLVGIPKHELSHELRIWSFYLLLLPLGVAELAFSEGKTDNDLFDQYSNVSDQILVDFCRYLSDNLKIISELDQHESGQFSIKNLLSTIDKLV